jgi:hypothetical protein
LYILKTTNILDHACGSFSPSGNYMSGLLRYAFCSLHLFRILIRWFAHTKREKEKYHCTYCS